MAPIESYELKLTILEVNGLKVQYKDQYYGRRPTKPVMAFASCSDKKETITSIPSLPIIANAMPSDYNARYNEYIALWGQGCTSQQKNILAMKINLRKKNKNSSSINSKVREIEIGLMCEGEILPLGASVININGPLDGTKLELPIYPLGSNNILKDNSKKNSVFKKKFQKKNFEELNDDHDSYKTDDVTTKSFMIDESRSYSLSKNASLNVFVTVAPAKQHNDTNVMGNDAEHFLSENQQIMASATKFQHPITFETSSQISVQSSISGSFSFDTTDQIQNENILKENSPQTCNSQLQDVEESYSLSKFNLSRKMKNDNPTLTTIFPRTNPANFGNIPRRKPLTSHMHISSTKINHMNIQRSHKRHQVLPTPLKRKVSMSHAREFQSQSFFKDRSFDFSEGDSIQNNWKSTKSGNHVQSKTTDRKNVSPHLYPVETSYNPTIMGNVLSHCFTLQKHLESKNKKYGSAHGLEKKRTSL
mmetsp:Transcript_22911/g.32294  ORF Transcript_22911/g.32294 Transcript_22911/m.32294 type:complete len:477 (-) Transcript_22911:297-1727(-)